MESFLFSVNGSVSRFVFHERYTYLSWILKYDKETYTIAVVLMDESVDLYSRKDSRIFLGF